MLDPAELSARSNASNLIVAPKPGERKPGCAGHQSSVVGDGHRASPWPKDPALRAVLAGIVARELLDVAFKFHRRRPP